MEISVAVSFSIATKAPALIVNVAGWSERNGTFACENSDRVDARQDVAWVIGNQNLIPSGSAPVCGRHFRRRNAVRGRTVRLNEGDLNGRVLPKRTVRTTFFRRIESHHAGSRTTFAFRIVAFLRRDLRSRGWTEASEGIGEVLCLIPRSCRLFRAHSSLPVRAPGRFGMRPRICCARARFSPRRGTSCRSTYSRRRRQR